jgi:hypothetical protein
MEALQEYGVYLMVLGGLLIVAGLIIGYLSTLPSHSSTLSIPTVVSTSGTSAPSAPAAPAAPATAATVAASGVSAGSDNVIHEEAPRVTRSPDDAGGAPAPASSSTGSINIDVIEKLERLNRLRELGTITQEEYTALRQQIMNT